MAKENKMIVNGWHIHHTPSYYWEVEVDGITHCFEKYNHIKEWIEKNLPKKD